MEGILEAVSRPWPWYVAGPLIGLIVPLLLLAGGKSFGISSSYRDICAATLPGRVEFFRYDWKASSWNLLFVLGIFLGGVVAATLLAPPDPFVGISEATAADLRALGLRDLSGLVPSEVIGWSGLTTLPGLVMVVGGAFLVGFGARWAGGCTSGHAITGLASRQLPSLVAVLGFFAGGLVATHLLIPLLF